MHFFLHIVKWKSIKLISNSFSCIHKVSIANRNLLSIIDNDLLAVGQRIYVGGRLKSTNEYVESQRRQEVEVLANEIFLLESNPKVTDEDDQIAVSPKIQIDENSVEMLAFVGTEVQNQNNLVVFSLRTHFTKRLVFIRFKRRPNSDRSMGIF